MDKEHVAAAIFDSHTIVRLHSESWMHTLL
jgi:hypothetical protein